MRFIVSAALAASALALAAPASAGNSSVLLPNDPCSYAAVTGAIACQGYYSKNQITGTTGSLTTAAELAAINLLLTGTPATNDTTPTSNTSAYTGSYPGLDYSKVLGAIDGLNGNATLNFGSLNLTGLTIVGAHFGNSDDSSANSVTAFWLVDLGSTVTHSLQLTSGAGSSNAQIFATGVGAVPEPATWALMLFGFGGMGVALRRGRRNHVRLAQIA